MTSSVHVGRYKIDPGEEVHLDKIDPDDTSGFEGKSADEPDESKKLNEKLRQLQEMLYAEHRKKLLVILQAVDTGGKDGVIHRVFQGVNPQGVQVAHFGVPRKNQTTISSGDTTKASQGKERLSYSTVATTRVFLSREFTSLSRRTSGGDGTVRSTTSKSYCPKTKR